MKTFIKAILFSTLFSIQAIAANHKDVLAAYNDGDFTKAFELACEIAAKNDAGGAVFDRCTV